MGIDQGDVAQGLDIGEANLALQLVDKPHPELPNVPLAVSLAKTSEGPNSAAGGGSRSELDHPAYSLPPGHTEDRVKILQKGVYGHHERSGVSRRYKISAGH